MTPATLTITGTDNTSVYNGGIQTNKGAIITGQVGNQKVVVSGGYAQATNVNEGSVSDAPYGSYTLSYSKGAEAGNYSVVTNYSGSLTITPATVSLSATKTYDGNKTLSDGQVTITTGIGTETLSYSNATSSSANVLANSNHIRAITLSLIHI